MSDNVSRRMPCPSCEHQFSGVTDSRGTSGGWQRRRRVCLSCGHRWTTMEVPTELVTVFPKMIERMRAMRDELTAILGDAEETKSTLEGIDASEDCRTMDRPG